MAFHADRCGSYVEHSVAYEALLELAASVVDHNQGMSTVAYIAKYVAAQARRGDVSAMEHDM